MEETKSKIDPFVIFKWVLFTIGLIIVIKLLRKFNILGESEETTKAKLLNTDAAFSATTTDMTTNPDNKFLLAIKKKFGNRPTAKQLEGLLPNKKAMPKLITQINDSRNIFSPNDASKVLGAFRRLISQYEVNFFSTLYEVTNHEDMFGKLDKLLRDTDMAKLHDMVTLKPVI